MENTTSTTYEKVGDTTYKTVEQAPTPAPVEKIETTAERMERRKNLVDGRDANIKQAQAFQVEIDNFDAETAKIEALGVVMPEVKEDAPGALEEGVSESA